MAEHIIYCGQVILLQFADIFQAMLEYAFVPAQFKESIMVPIGNGGMVCLTMTITGISCTVVYHVKVV